MLKSLSPIDVALIKKIGGNGSSYTLPIASATQLGGVQPVAKTDAMTQSVGVDEAGGLWAPPGSGGGNADEWELIQSVTTEGNDVYMVDFTIDLDKYSEFFIAGRAQAYDVKNDILYTSAAIKSNGVAHLLGTQFSEKSIALGGKTGPLGFFVFVKDFCGYYYPFAISSNGNSGIDGAFCAANPYSFNPGTKKTPTGLSLRAHPSAGVYNFAEGSIFEFWGRKK